MSAYVVTRETIAAIVVMADKSQYGNGRSSDAEINEIGNLLWKENQISVNHRYNDNDEIERFSLKTGDRITYSTMTPIQALKLCDCLEYQSCEHDAWFTSRAKEKLEQIRSLLINKLPGYEEASWGLYST